MTDLELIEKRWSNLLENLWGLCFDTPNGGSKLFHLQLDMPLGVYITCDPYGGLEGYYRNTYSVRISTSDRLDLCDLTMEDTLCGGGDITSVEIHEDARYLFEEVKGEKCNMATLSTRTALEPEHAKDFTLTQRGETTMSALRTLNLTLVDNNDNLKAGEKIVFQSLGYVTDHSDDRTIQQILMTGEVAKELAKHNEKRTKVVDKQIQRNTGRKVMLKEVEIFDLDWQVVRVA